MIKQFQSADKLRKCCCLAAAKSHKAIPNPSVFDHLGPLLGPSGPFWTISDKNVFLPQMDKVGFDGGASEQNINSYLKWFKRAGAFHLSGRIDILLRSTSGKPYFVPLGQKIIFV